MDQSEERLALGGWSRQRPLQQGDGAQRQPDLLEVEAQQGSASSQLTRSVELQGQGTEVHGVAQAQPFVVGQADLQRGAKAAQQPSAQRVGVALSLGPDGLQLPATDQVFGVDSTSLMANLPLARQQIVPCHGGDRNGQGILDTVADMLSDRAQAC